MKSLRFLLTLLITSQISIGFAQPANDDCAGAQSVVDDGTCINGTTVAANDNWVDLVGCQTGAPAAVHEDVWYSFTATNSVLSVDVTAGAGWSGNIEVVVWESATGCVGPFTELASNCGTSPVNVSTTGLTPGNTYYITVSNEAAGTTGAFTICTLTTAPPVNCTDNDDCSTAATITLNPSAAPGTAACITDCNTGAAPGIDFTGNNCEDMGGPTVWYQFTTDAGAATIDINLTSTDFTTPEFTVWQNTCNPWVVIDNSCTEGTGGAASLSGIAVTPNTTYYISISDVNGGSGNFDLCVTQNLDASLCNTGGSITETASSDPTTPVGGPYSAGEVVSFCYTIDPWEKINCNWLQGIVPTFGNCWDPASFDASGMPVTNTPPVQAGVTTGTWSWYANGVVTYNNIVGSLPPGAPVGAGWFFVCTGCPAGVNGPSPNDSWGDGDANGPPGTECDPAGNGYVWSVCFDLIAGDGTNCGTGDTDCSVSFKTYADGEIGGWTDIGCVGDQADVYNAGFICCPTFDDPGPQVACDSYTLPPITGLLLTGNEMYYTGTGGTGTPYSAGAVINYGDFVSWPITLYIYDATSCGTEVPFTLEIGQTPVITNPGPMSSCDSVQLPAIAGTNLNSPAYYDGAGGTGTMYAAGDWITTGGTYYIYDNTGAPTNCSDEVSFTITITPTPVITNPGPLTGCDSLQLPAIAGTNLNSPAYYDGAGGTGTMYAAGDWISVNGTYYIYDNTGAPDNCSDEVSFTITLTPSPIITNPGPLTGCDSVQLPAITGTNLNSPAYYDGAGGTGTMYAAGDWITVSGTYYIYDNTGAPDNCTDEVSFTITITPTPVITNPGPLTGCDSIQLPAIAGTNLNSPAYYDGAGGTGTMYAAGDWISVSGTYYIYDNTGAPDNCSDEVSFTITLTPSPIITNPGPLTDCDSVQLPAIAGTNLNSPAYYDGTGGTGNMYAAGDWITVSGTYYIYDNTGAPDNCAAEEAFTITITPSPVITNPGPLAGCDSVQLPVINGTNLNVPAYYDGPGGTGNMYAIGDWVTTSGTYYIYDNTGAPNNCTDEVSFTVTVNLPPVITLVPHDPSVCNGNDGWIEVNGAGTGTINWTGTASGTSGAGQALPYNILGLIAGNYSVTFTDGTTGCTSAAVATVLNNPNAPIIDPISDTSSCEIDYTVPDPTVAITGTNLTGGQAFYSASGGNPGDLIAPGTVITSAMSPFTIYAYDNNGSCASEISFVVYVNTNPTAAITPDPIEYCEGGTVALDGGPAGGSGVYSNHAWTGDVAILNSTGVVNPSTLASASAGVYNLTYTVTDNNGCIGSDGITVTIVSVPVITNPGPLTGCDSVQLPAIAGTNLTAGVSYYDGPAGTGNAYAAGDWITVSGTYYIYDNTGGIASCSDEVSFTITLTPTPVITNPGPLTGCDSIQLPAITGTNLTAGVAYYDGAGGTGNMYVAGDWISTNGTYYIYDNTGAPDNCSDEVSFTITLTPSPVITNPGNMTGCDSVQLPAIAGTSLTAGVSYYDGAGGTGNMYSAGDWITVSGTYYIYDNTGAPDNCSDEVSFTITLTPSPVITNPGNMTGCDNVILPVIAGTNLTGGVAYYDGPGGTGNSYAAGASITTSGTYYIYDNTGAPDNCSDEVSFTITLTPSPVITNPGAMTGCDSVQLPAIAGTNLTAGVSYYDGAGGTGNAYATGDWITVSGTYYIYDNTGAPDNCSDEVSFTVTLTPSPIITNPGPLTGCDSVQLPAIAGTNLTAGVAYYDGMGGTGNAYAAGDWVFTSGTYYLYDNTGAPDNCSDEESFTVTINATPFAVPTTFTTPICEGEDIELIGNLVAGATYDWTGPNGFTSTLQSPVIAGATIADSGDYVLTVTLNGCTSQPDSVTITVIVGPVIDPIADQTACESFDLPTITGTNLSGNQGYYDDSQLNGGQPITGPITTSQTVWMIDSVGNCTNETSYAITINPLPEVTGITGGGVYCDGDVVNDITVTVTGSPDWTVYYTLDGTAQNMTGSSSPINLGNAPGTYVLDSIADVNCSNTATGTETIVVNPIPAAPTAGTDSEYCSTVTFEDMTASGGNGTFTWYSDQGLTNVLGTGPTYAPANTVGTTSYYVTETENGCEGPYSEVIIVVNECDIVIPSAFTPDGDGAHDDWEIYNLDQAYPNSIVTIYNRWGNLLFTSDQGAYDANRWDGTYNGQLLPVGSYYYIIEFNDDEKGSAKGTVSIVYNK